MNYVITGSLGHISKPVATKLKNAGHHVTVVTSNQDRVKDIEAKGARAAVGSIEDSVFLKKTFAGADAVYLMIPANWTLTGGWLEYQKKIANNYVDAIRESRVKNVVLLSSVGADLRKETGPVDGLGYAEEKLETVNGLNLKILRPSYFYSNLLGQIPIIKNMGIAGGNFGNTDEKLILVHTDDIAEVVAEELLNLGFHGVSIRYIAGDERHPKEIAELLGKAIGKPGLQWVQFKDADTLNSMLQSGLNKSMAEGYVQLGVSLREGKMQGHYWKNRPAKLGRTKLEDFVKEFAGAYNAVDHYH